MSFQVSCLPLAIGEEVAKADLARTPLRQVLSFKLGVEITGARETVSAVLLAGRAARELGCRRGTAAFRSDRVSLGAGGAPVVHDRVFIPGDRFRITRQFQYNGASKTPPSAPMSPQGEEAQPPTEVNHIQAS
jgi:GntR family transcriptional regulator